MTPNYVLLMTYSRGYPCPAVLDPWTTIWEQDEPLREILRGYRESAELTKKSSLKADIIRTDIQRMNEQIQRNVPKFQAQALSCAAVEVTIEGLNQVEKEFRKICQIHILTFLPIL